MLLSLAGARTGAYAQPSLAEDESALAAPPAGEQGPAPWWARRAERFGVLGRLLAKARSELRPWEMQAVVVRTALRRFFQQQGWTGESDRFARDVVERLAEIPPWQMAERINTGVDLLSDRYGLGEQQAQHLRRIAWTETWRLLLKHAGTLATYGREIIEARLSGKPFTAEQVARWTKILEPIAEEAYERFEARALEFAELLTPQQRELLERDLAAYARRKQTTQELMDKWQAGQWRLEDWGLTPEMLAPDWAARQIKRRGKSDAGRDAGASALEPSDPLQPDTWTAYVQAFIRTYRLDAFQRAAAYAILKELKRRANLYIASHRPDLERLDRLTRQAQSAEIRASIEKDRRALLQPVSRMFEELKARLNRLPTAAQRAAATRPAAASARAVSEVPSLR